MSTYALSVNVIFGEMCSLYSGGNLDMNQTQKIQRPTWGLNLGCSSSKPVFYQLS